jgi:hypothetical protein
MGKLKQIASWSIFFLLTKIKNLLRKIKLGLNSLGLLLFGRFGPFVGSDEVVVCHHEVALFNQNNSNRMIGHLLTI